MIFSLERFRAKSLKQQLDFETRSYRAGIVAIGGNTIMNVGNMMELAMQK
ncbi:MAG: hypothetical protein Q7R44_00355 [bacterium]|nr:hypothetical protein [bacterium]